MTRHKPWQRAAALTTAEPPAKARSWYRISAKADTEEDRAVVDIYDVIGGWFWGVDAATFVQELREIDASVIEVHVNSPGGDVYDGIAIMNALLQHDARVEVVVDGLAASAASVIAVGGADELVMARYSELMIHEAWGIEIGDAEDMRRMAENLDRICDNLARVYADKAGGTPESWREAMRAETWYSDEEAVAAGLADRIVSDTETDDEAKNRWDLSVFAYAGRGSAPEPRRAAALSRPKNERSGGVPTFLEEIRGRLGTAADADEPTVLAALDEALTEGTEETPPAALPDGVVAVEQSVLDQLRTDAQAGREAHTRQQSDDRERTVQAAIDDGRIPPARRQAWLNMLSADPQAAETLAGLETGVVPVNGPMGHDGEAPAADSVDVVRESDAYKNWKV